jgi:hypothetical protein
VSPVGHQPHDRHRHRDEREQLRHRAQAEHGQAGARPVAAEQKQAAEEEGHRE